MNIPNYVRMSKAVVALATVASFASAAAFANAGGVPLQADASGSLNLRLGFAEVIRVQGTIGTIVLGRADVADASPLDLNRLVVTGLAAGTTNMIVMDDVGVVLADYAVHVMSDPAGTVTIRRGMSVQTYACPDRTCEASDTEQAPAPPVGQNDGM